MQANPKEIEPIDKLAELDKFTGRFEEPLEQKESNCYSDAELVAIAEEIYKGDMPDHLTSCSQCKEIVDILQATDAPDSRLHDFLAATKRKAWELAPEQPSSVVTYLRALFSIAQSKWVSLGVGILALLLIGVGIYYLSNPRREQTNSAMVSFAEDKPLSVLQSIELATNQLSTSVPTFEQIEKKTKEVDQYAQEFNQMVQSTDIQPRLRAKIQEALAGFQSEAFQQFQQIENAKAFEAPIQITATPDTEKIDAVYTAVSQAISKTVISKDKPPTPSERVAIFQSASKEIDIIGITNDQVSVRDKVPNRQEGQKVALDNAWKTLAKKFNVVFYTGEQQRDYIAAKVSAASSDKP